MINQKKLKIRKKWKPKRKQQCKPNLLLTITKVKWLIKGGEVLGLKLINPDEHCEDDKESKVPVSPLKIPFANDTR